MASEHTRHPQYRAVQFDYMGLMCAILKSPTTAKILNATNARLKSTVNSSQRRETRRSTRHTILRCDELTGSRSWLLPLSVGQTATHSFTANTNAVLHWNVGLFFGLRLHQFWLFLHRKNDINQRYRCILQAVRRWRAEFLLWAKVIMQAPVRWHYYRGTRHHLVRVLTVH